MTTSRSSKPWALYVGAISSSLFRVISYVFLRLVSFSYFGSVGAHEYTLQIPIRLCKYIVPGLYLVYLVTIPLASRSTPPTEEKEARNGSGTAKGDEPPARTTVVCVLLRLRLHS